MTPNATTLIASRYNRLIPADDGWLLVYNALTNAFARIPPSVQDLVQHMLSDPNHAVSDGDHTRQVVADLRKGGFIVDAGLDELELQRLRNKAGRFATNFLGLTIAPTLSCNFRCTYCFEEHRNETMTVEVEDALIRLVEKRRRQIQMLQVCWFGGEPTLRMDIVERLVGKFDKLCRDNDIAFPAMSMTTNGYLLTSDLVKSLKALNITDIQVTIDGPPEVHDRRRVLGGGRGTFRTVFENVKAALGTLKISVRINVDRSNVAAMDGLFELFVANGLSGKLPFYFGHVQQYGDACADISSACLSTKEYSALILDLQRRSREKGLASPIRYPNVHAFGYCTADHLSGYVVAPSGALYKCYSELSSDLSSSVGTVFESPAETFQVNNLCRYMNWDPYSLPDCLACNCLPICAGGCPYRALKHGDGCACTDFKFNLDEVLKLKYDELKRMGKCPPDDNADGEKGAPATS